MNQNLKQMFEKFITVAINQISLHCVQINKILAGLIQNWQINSQKIEKHGLQIVIYSPRSPSCRTFRKLLNLLIKVKIKYLRSQLKMCTPINTKPKICRRFTFQNQNSDSRTFIINISQFEENGMLDLRAVLQYLQDKGLNVDNYFFQLPQFNNAFVQVSKQFMVNCANIDDREIFFTMIRKKNTAKSKGQNIKQQQKRLKQVQRVIGDVIQKVKYWRWLHSNKGISLKQAAIVVDIPKKSLDDYFLQLRQGELCGYNFAENLNSKMGDLRLYVKKHQKKSGKLPVQIKNIKCFCLVNDIQQNSTNVESVNSDDFANEIPGSSMDVQSQSQEQQKIQKDLFLPKEKQYEDYYKF